VSIEELGCSRTSSKCLLLGIKKYGNLICGVKPEEVEDTKVLIRIRKSKKDRQHDGVYLRMLVSNTIFMSDEVRAI
jgi:hypothetical protein